MVYRLFYTAGAERDMAKLDPGVRERLGQALERFAQDPFRVPVPNRRLARDMRHSRGLHRGVEGRPSARDLPELTRGCGGKMHAAAREGALSAAAHSCLTAFQLPFMLLLQGLGCEVHAPAAPAEGGRTRSKRWG